MRINILKIPIIFLFLCLSITSVIAENEGLQSFEDYPIDPFPEEDLYLFSVDY